MVTDRDIQAAPTLRRRVETSVLILSPSSRAKSAFGVVNREKPQFKQTKTFGKTKTPGLSTLLRPLKWIIISAVNSA
jgi:hypothetical protein